MSKIRRLFLAPLLLSIAACDREPDFDARYDAAQKRLEEKVQAIERDLGQDPPPAKEADKGADTRTVKGPNPAGSGANGASPP